MKKKKKSGLRFFCGLILNRNLAPCKIYIFICSISSLLFSLFGGCLTSLARLSFVELAVLCLNFSQSFDRLSCHLLYYWLSGQLFLFNSFCLCSFALGILFRRLCFLCRFDRFSFYFLLLGVLYIMQTTIVVGGGGTWVSAWPRPFYAWGTVRANLTMA